MSEDSPRNDVQEEALSSKEIIDHESTLSSSKNPHPPPPVYGEEESEYGCKYCNKKFSNKQALGGHQNAHTLERSIEKKIQEWRTANSRYLPCNNFTGSLINRSQEFLNRAMMNMPYLAQQGTMQHPGMMPRPLPGINEGYPGWPRVVPGNVTQFMAYQGSSCLENRPPGIGFSTPRPVPNKSINMQMNGRETQGVEDDSGLDLTLRL